MEEKVSEMFSNFPLEFLPSRMLSSLRVKLTRTMTSDIACAVGSCVLSVLPRQYCRVVVMMRLPWTRGRHDNPATKVRWWHCV